MTTAIVEQMLVELGFDTSKFASEADKAIKKHQQLEKAITDTEKSSQKATKAHTELAKKSQDSIEQIAKMGQELAKVTKELTKFFGIIIGSTGLFKLANDVSRANMEMSKLSDQTGMSTKSLTDWRNAASAFGGSAQNMTSSLTSIKQAMNGLVMFGDASMLPYFNALGVGLVDSAGKVRQLDEVMLDLADAFQKMPTDQAYTIGKKMGFDDGTINMLVSGRKEMQEILDIQKKMYHSDKQSIALNKELNKQQTILNAHWQSMKQMIGDALTPILIRLIRVVNGFFDFMQRHEKVIKSVFQVAAMVIGLLLIPTLLNAARALMGFIAPFTPLIKVFGLLGAAISPVTIAITALGAAFLLLLDDYKTWAKGGNSLFDWTAFSNGIKDSKMLINELGESFKNLSASFSDMATEIIAKATGEKKEDISDFIGESVYRLFHGGKTYEEVNGSHEPPTKPIVIGKKRTSNSAPNSVSNVAPADVAVKAANYATKHAKGRSTGKCARFVNDSLRAQGIKIWGHGKDVAKNLLKRNDFEQVEYNENYVPQIGDIMSMPSSSKSKHNYGHVAIWNGYRWVSDFVQQKTRGNTAAPNDAYFADIKSGKIKPTIARMKSTRKSSEVVPKGLMVAAFAPVQNTGQLEANVNRSSVAKGSATKGLVTKSKGSFAQELNAAMDRYGIKDEKARASFLSNVDNETGGGRKFTENLNYKFARWAGINSNTKRWAKNHSEAEFKRLTAQDKANIMYANMIGNKNPNDGWTFRGRGGMQLTGRANYQAYADYSGRQDIMSNPDLIATDPRLAADSAAWYFMKRSKAGKQAMAGNIAGARKTVNGGYIGMDNYKNLYTQYLQGKGRLSKNNMKENAAKAQSMIANVQRMQTTSVAHNDNRRYVNVNIPNMNVQTSSNTVSGNTVTAMKEVQNYMFNQLGVSMT